MLSKALPWRSNSHGARSEFPVPAVLFYTLGLTPFFKLCNPHNTTRPPPTSTTSAAPGGPCKPSLDSWVFSDSQIEQKKCFAQSLAPLVLLKTVFLFNLAGPRGAVCPLLVRPVFAPRVLACVVLGPSGVGARRRVAVAGAGRRSGGSCAAPFAPSGPSGWSPGAVAVPVAAPLRSAACGLRSLRSLRPPKEDERARSNVNTRQSCGAS